MDKDHAGGLYASAGRCWKSVASGGQTGARDCKDEVVWAGTYTFQNGDMWLAFSCDGHEDGLSGAHALTDADRIELEARRRNWAAAREGRPWIPPQPLRSGRRGQVS